MAMSEKMKKRLKKELIEGVIAVIILFCGYCGCEAYIDKQVEEWKAIEYVGISNEDTYNAEVYFKTIEEISGYESTQNYYSSEIYYNELNSQEKFVYDTYKYAYENNITHLFFQESLIDECNYSLTEILEMFALDSPVMEQNLVSGEDEYSYTINNQFLFRYVERELKGSYINIDIFTKEKADKRQKAIKQAKKIKFDFTDDMTEFDKAKVIYTYLGENVEYENDDSKDKVKVIMKTHYLYDAICKKKTNCDGFANAFSLFCSLNGIENFEKTDDHPEDEEGHTWNCVLLDGVWYNVDATASDEVLAEDRTKDLYSRFAYSDKAQTEKPIFEKIIPDCKKDTVFVGCSLKSCNEDGAVRTVAEAYRNTDNDVFAIIINKKTTQEASKKLLQGVADYLRINFSYSILEGENKAIIYINK